MGQINHLHAQGLGRNHEGSKNEVESFSAGKNQNPSQRK